MSSRTALTRSVLAGLFVALSGCTAGLPSSVVPSTSPLPAGVRGSIPAYGSDCQYRLFGVIPLTGSPSSQRALVAAKEHADSDVLTDVTIDHGGGFYILWSNHCIRVEGKGVPRALLERIETQR